MNKFYVSPEVEIEKFALPTSSILTQSTGIEDFNQEEELDEGGDF